MAEMGMSTLELDITKAESIKKCHQQAREITGGRLDILVNNAQVFPKNPRPFSPG